MKQSSVHAASALGMESDARKCGNLCLAAAMSLRERGFASELEAAHEALQSSLEGTSTELDNALKAAGRLRKAIMPTVTNNDWNANSHLMCSTVFQLAHLLPQYLGDPATHVNNRVQGRFEQRLKLAKQLSQPLIKSVTSLAKLKPVHQEFGWNVFDKALQDCLLLNEYLENAAKDQGSLQEAPLKDVSIDLSNAYWAFYISLRQEQGPSGLRQAALRRSIEAAERGSLSEMSQCFLPAKVEHLAQLFEREGDLKHAADNYAHTVHLLVDSGLLNENRETLDSWPLEKILRSSGPLHSLVRPLKAHVRVTSEKPLNAPDHDDFFDACGLDPAQRGFLLEAQLQAILDCSASAKAMLMNTARLRKIADLLMETYTAKEFPLRRLRVAADILRIQIMNLFMFDAALIEDLAPSPVVSFNRDSGLDQLAMHYAMRAKLLSALATDEPDLRIFLRHVEVLKKSLDRKSHDGQSVDAVDGFPRFLTELDLVSSFMQMKGFNSERLELLEVMARLCETHAPSEPSLYVSKATDLGFQLVRLGRLKRATPVLDKIGRILADHAVSEEAALHFHTVAVEYYTLVGSMEEWQSHLQKATAMYRSLSGSAETNGSLKVGRSQLFFIASEWLYTLSINASTFDSAANALHLQRRSVKLTYALWDSLRKKSIAEIRPHRNKSLDVGETQGSEERSPDAELAALSRCARLWPLMPSLFDRLLRLAELFSDEGLLQEAQHYLDEAKKIAKALRADRLTTHAQMIGAGFDLLRGDTQGGFDRLKGLKESIDNSGKPMLSVQYCVAMSKAHGLRGDHTAEEAELQNAFAMISKAEEADTRYVESRPKKDLAALTSKVEEMTLTEKKSREPKPLVKAKKQAPKANKTAPRSSKRGPVKSSTPRVPLREIENESREAPSRQLSLVIRQQAESLTRQDKVDEAQKLLESISPASSLPPDSFLQAKALAENSIRQTLLEYSISPVFSLLKESTTSYPSVARAAPSNGKAVPPAPTQAKRQVASKAKVKAARAELPVRSNAEVSKNADHLVKCFKALTSVHQASQTAASVTLIHKMADLLCKDAMMLSVADIGEDKPMMSATFVAYAMEMGRSIATLREVSAIASENALSAEKGATLEIDKDILAQIPIPKIDPARFQAAYVDILPGTWTVISVSVSDDREELLLSKMRATQPPFVLSIPLARHSARDADNDVFGFKQCMDELSGFIDLANFSTHSSGKSSENVSKKEWWEARSALDARLQDLLSNVENLWLGGFRGIFSKHSPPREQLSRFQKSFYGILDKHLPSRRKVGKNGAAAETKPVSFDPRILELFVGLGHPREVEEVGSSLMDLLYFVVDILQFRGERNAYDEIDFDSIVIAVTDALVCYHETVRKNPPAESATHTILILDKALHSFPWESMPCLVGQAVSRLPSLVSLRTRILLQREQQKERPTFPSDGLHIDPSNGACILNPAGDLTNTEATLQPHLSKLPASWSSTIRREPTEADITSALSTRALYLYFGHGSGAQYVRARRVRRLERCAVALLMGCSSGAVKVAGAFESYGTPLNYLFGGAPAVVGTLWDVTDKDIDRFSVRCLERWGLFKREEVEGTGDVNASPLKGKGLRIKGKGKAKGPDPLLERCAVGLDRAVADARDACILRYLNGAAPVVYGIPVYLWPRV